MKALLCTQFGGLNRLELKEVAPPTPGPGQLRIAVKAASLNFPDALMVQGLYQIKPALPFSPGSEFSGLVVEVGSAVKRYRVGDRVIAFGLGGFAEQALADAERCMPLPLGMDFEVGAALILTYCTSLRGLKDRGRIQAGETLLVLGAAGGVGAAAVEIGRALGARVIACASSEEKLAFCRELGADETIDYTKEKLRDRVLALTDGLGVDLVYDPVGGPLTEQALRATAWGGRLLVIGFAAGEIPKIALNLCLLKERALVGVYWGDSLKHDPASHERNVAQLLAWIANGKIRPRISERVPLAAVPALMARMAARQIMGKAIVLPEAA